MAASALDKSALKHLEMPVESPVPPESAWGKLVLESKFAEAIALIELDMADERPEKSTETDYLEKLWWVRAQLATEGMPLAALTTPLSAIFDGLKQSSNFNALACSTYYLLARQLGEKKQTRLAVVFFEHALEFADSLGFKERGALRAGAAAVFREEISRAESKREPANYISKLKTRAEELERLEKPKTEETRTSKPPAEDPKATLSLSAKSIRSAEFTQKSIRDDEELTQSTVSAPASKPSQVKGFVLGVSCVVLLLIAWDFGFKDRKDSLLQLASNTAENSPQEAASSETPSQAAIPTATAPVPASASVPPSASQTVSSEFNDVIEKNKAIDAKFEDLGERLKNVTFKGIDKPKSLEELSKDPEVDQAALKNKEAPPTQKAQASPTPGGDELATLEGTRTNPQLDPDKVPLLDPSRISAPPPVEIAAPSNPRSTEPVAANDRDSIQPSLPQFGGPPDPKGRGLDGGPVRSYPVERLQQAEVYRTITETNVLSAPSLLAQTVTRLPSETSVQVVSRVGQWLELRSVGGKRGFIYAQDAVPSRRR